MTLLTPTPREIEADLKHRPNERAHIERLYATRDRLIDQLARQGRVSAPDLDALDRLGRCRIANEHWQICEIEARSRLLDDEHHQVRSCAWVANQATLGRVSPPATC
ncbi:hypothetical protein LJR129_005048 [Acidovorax sp. LjRoot129]|uniref:hypothetical protein n=1 Tax=unclassified Acidovorax TaxID=2684926 RepID=UPI003ECDDC27